MFGGFTESDFEAYASSKWRSNAFNRQRLEVKEKLVALGRLLGDLALASDGSPLLCEPSVEHPALWNHKQVDAQHLFFSRNQEARTELDRIIDKGRSLASLIDDPSPQRSHLFLAVSIDHDRVAVTLKLHTDATVDRENLERKLADGWQRESFLALVGGLDPGFEIAVDGGPRVTATELDDAVLDDLLATLRRPLAPTESRWLVIGQAIDRATAVTAGAELLEPVRRILGALLPLYHFIAWSRDNDHVAVRDRLRESAVSRKRRGLAQGDRVRISAGVFAGRVGVIQDLDSRGRPKVLVGRIPIVVEPDQVDKL